MSTIDTLIAQVRNALTTGTGEAVAEVLRAADLDLVRSASFPEFADTGSPPIGIGSPASPGAASGRIVTSAEAAVVAADAGERVILVRSETTPDDVIEKTLDINVKGVMYACRHAIPHMMESAKRCGETSSIVNVASFVAHLGAATPQVAYTASKGAVLAMTREIAAIYARKGVRANALCPGPVMTPLLAKFLSDDAKRERRLVHIPMGRFGEPHEIVNGALFLASNESSWMTGQSLIIDGGITSAYVTPEGPAWS